MIQPKSTAPMWATCSVLAAAIGLASCRPAPLTSEGLYGPAPRSPDLVEAGAPDRPRTESDGSVTSFDLAEPNRDGSVATIDAGTVETGHGGPAVDGPAAEVPAVDSGARTCMEEPFPPGSPACGAEIMSGVLSGMVVDACDGNLFLNANVGIDGQHGCSHEGKGSFSFRNLRVGCRLTLTASRPGYQPFCAVLTIPREGRGGFVIRLMRTAGCDITAPAAEACVCTPPCTPL